MIKCTLYGDSMKIFSFCVMYILIATACSDNRESSGATIPECGNNPPPPVEYTVVEYEVSFEKFLTGDPIVGEITPDDFVISLTSDYESNTRSTSIFDGVTFSLFESAYACSVETRQIPTQSLVSFSITSTGSFGEGYEPGENLVELFMALEASPSESSSRTVEQPVQYRKMLLRASPVEKHHIFTITIELDDGLYYSQSSEIIVFDLDA